MKVVFIPLEFDWRFKITEDIHPLDEDINNVLSAVSAM